MPDEILTDMDKKDIERLLQRYRLGEKISREEKAWLDSFYLHKAIHADQDIGEEELQKNLSHVETEIKSRIATKKVKRLAVSWYAAAAILAIVSLGYLFLEVTIFKNNELVSQNGELEQIVLEDGTKVTLNAGSKLIYPKSFEQNDLREVTLLGEAYFDVAKNPDKPFHIHTARMEIRVLGTAFNVRDYTGEEEAETALIRGKVEIWKKGEHTERFVLKPKEKFVLSANKEQNLAAEPTAIPPANPRDLNIQPLEIRAADGTPVETEWMLKRMTIREESLTEIAKRLERIYGVKITIADAAIAAQVYSASFDDEPIEDVLRGLQTVIPFRYTLDQNGNIEIYR